jgi:hypothetical protein
LFTVDGIRQAGLGAASGNLAIQLPLIAQEFPEIANCHPGTINLELNCPLLVLAPDHRTRAIFWDKSFPDGEVFDLLRIEFEAPVGASSVQAWLYIPHGSPHRRKPRIHEVIAPKLTLQPGIQCRIRVNRNAVQLPYSQWPMIVVI